MPGPSGGEPQTVDGSQPALNLVPTRPHWGRQPSLSTQAKADPKSCNPYAVPGSHECGSSASSVVSRVLRGTTQGHERRAAATGRAQPWQVRAHGVAAHVAAIALTHQTSATPFDSPSATSGDACIRGLAAAPTACTRALVTLAHVSLAGEGVSCGEQICSLMPWRSVRRLPDAAQPPQPRDYASTHHGRKSDGQRTVSAIACDGRDQDTVDTEPRAAACRSCRC